MTPIGFGPLSDADVRRFVLRLRRRVEARCELQFASPYQLLVAVVLSAQATDKSVNAATPGLFAQAPDPAAMVDLGPEKILALIRRIGLAPTKARHVHALSQLLIERHGGKVPEERESLEALPGVGRKTANVVLDHAFGQPTLAVDTHVHRVANRLGICRTNLPEKTEQILLRRIPPKLLPSCHLRLVLFGRYTCMARNPQCPTCFARDLCTWPEKQA